MLCNNQGYVSVLIKWEVKSPVCQMENNKMLGSNKGF